MKTCTKCKQIKPLDNFCKNKNSKDELHCWCRKCVSEHDKKYRENNIEKVNSITRKWLSENKERQKQYNKEYRQKNKEKLRKYNNERKNRKYKNDPLYKLRILLSGAIRRHLKEEKNDSIVNLLPFTIEELKDHLLYDTNTNMHIDHIIPQSVYKNKNDYLNKCWNLRNLRLISKEENLLKGDKLDWNLVEEYEIFDLLPDELNPEKGH